MRTPWGDRVCRCECHRDGDEDHRECCTWLAQRERDDAQSRIDAVLALHTEEYDICADANIEWPCPTVKALRGE